MREEDGSMQLYVGERGATHIRNMHHHPCNSSLLLVEGIQ
jgi:hypothetical protein